VGTYRFVTGLRQFGRKLTDTTWWGHGGIRIGLNWPLFIIIGIIAIIALIVDCAK
jgi:hypothetical protein